MVGPFDVPDLMFVQQSSLNPDLLIKLQEGTTTIVGRYMWLSVVVRVLIYVLQC